MNFWGKHEGASLGDSILEGTKMRQGLHRSRFLLFGVGGVSKIWTGRVCNIAHRKRILAILCGRGLKISI